MNNVIDLAAERRARRGGRGGSKVLRWAGPGEEDPPCGEASSLVDVAKDHGHVGIAIALGLEEDVSR